MSTAVHPASAWAAAHRTLLVVLLITAALVAGLATTVALGSRDTPTPVLTTPVLPPLQHVTDTCFGAPVGSAC